MLESIQTMGDALQHLENMKKNTNCICNVFNCLLDAFIYLFGGIFCVFLYSSCGEDNLEIIDISNQDGCIVIVPDIQYYTNDKVNYKYLDAIVDFCNEKKNNISFLLQTGDITNNNRFEQWNNAYQRFFSKLPKVFPIVFCLGNHDYYGNNGSASKRESNCPSELTPVSDVVMPTSFWDNYLKYVTLDNKKMAVLSLEFAPRNITLEWADKVIKDNKDIPIIILTHAFLNNSGKMFDSSDPKCDNKYSQKYYTMSNDYLNDSKEIFDKIIYNNPNVKMVVCGHCVSRNYIECLEKKNANNENVYCIMVNYQHYINGGSGNIGLLLYNQGRFELRSFNAESRLFGDVKISFDLVI